MFPGAITRPRAGIAAIAATCVFAILALATVAAPQLAAQSGAFGHQVLIDDDEILIAEPTTSFRPGAVYIYSQSGGAWRESNVLHAPDSGSRGRLRHPPREDREHSLHRPARRPDPRVRAWGRRRVAGHGND